MTQVDGRAKSRATSRGNGPRFAFDYTGAGHRDRDQPPAEGRGAARLRRPVARRSRPASRARQLEAVAQAISASTSAADREANPESADPNRERRTERNPTNPTRTPTLPRPADRVVSALDRRQHGRGLDALGARAVRVQPHVDSQRRHPRRQAASEVRRDHPRRTRAPRDLIDGYDAPRDPAGVSRRDRRRRASSSLKQFVAEGGTLVTLGTRRDLAIDQLPIPVRNLKKGLTPRPALRARHDSPPPGRHQHPMGYGIARRDTYGFYINSPFFSLIEGFTSQKTDRRRALSEHERRRVGLAERRGPDGRPRRGRVDRHEPGTGRAVRPAPAASRRRRTRLSRCSSTRFICRRPAMRHSGHRPTNETNLLSCVHALVARSPS